METQKDLPIQPPQETPQEKPKKNIRFFLILLGALLIVSAIVGVVIYRNKGDEPDIVPPIDDPALTLPASIRTALASEKRLISSEDIVSETIEVAPAIPSFKLPIDTDNIANFQDFANKIPLSLEAKSLLEKNGFAVISTPQEIMNSPEEFDTYYSALQEKDIPVFVSSDSLLHYYHVFFDTALMRLEKDIFYDDVWQMSKSFLDDQVSIYENTDESILKEAAKRNVIYLSIALELLKPTNDQTVSSQNVQELVSCYPPKEASCQQVYAKAIKEGTFSLFGEEEASKYLFTVPNFAKALVEEELKLIDDHKGWDCSPNFLYQEDYSQYIPRGHYTKSEKLKNYFKAVMWYGRITNLTKGSLALRVGKCNLHNQEGFISEEDAKTQTLSSLLLANKFTTDNNIQHKWNRLYAITSFFVGFSDDLGPIEYASAIETIFENNENIQADQLADKVEDIRKLIKEEFPKPKIYSGLGKAQLTVVFPPPLTDEQINQLKEQAEKLLANTQGFRMLGQREVVDSYLFSKIVSPYSGEYNGDKNKKPFTYVLTDMGREVRGFPRGLDIMALFGSKRAKEIITELGDANYSDYEKTFNELKQEIDSLPPSEWYKNIYWNWLHVLKSLLPEFGNGYPTFMQTTAWQDKELNTALASWSELRHDTILYVKQSYTMAERGGGPKERPIVGYVEPIPEFYSRLLNLSKMTESGLSRLLTKEELSNIGLSGAISGFNIVLSRLLDISKVELENKELSENDYGFIKNFGDHLESINKNLTGAGYGGQVDPDMFKTTMIADVHTDGNTEKVLEEGVGYIKTIIAAYKLPDGRILIGAGPAFSYFEFKHPMDDRLTDEAWRQMLKSDSPPEPEWVKSFSEQ